MRANNTLYALMLGTARHKMCRRRVADNAHSEGHGDLASLCWPPCPMMVTRDPQWMSRGPPGSARVGSW